MKFRQKTKTTGKSRPYLIHSINIDISLLFSFDRTYNNCVPQHSPIKKQDWTASRRTVLKDSFWSPSGSLKLNSQQECIKEFRRIALGHALLAFVHAGPRDLLVQLKRAVLGEAGRSGQWRRRWWRRKDCLGSNVKHEILLMYIQLT